MKTTTSHLKEIVMQGVFTACACISILAVALICIFLFANGLPTIFEIGPLKFLLGTTWKPGNNLYGILPMILGSIYVTAGAIIVGVPIGLLTAIYMSRFASPRINKVLLPAVQLLAGIPSVVYGFFGMIVMVPAVQAMVKSDFFKTVLHVKSGKGMSLFTASLLLGIMILPTIITVSKTSLDAVPQSYYEGSLALGATHERSVFCAVLPAAKSGVMSAVILGVGRAIGETMAVVMVAGNQTWMPKGLFQGLRTMTSNIVIEMGYAADLHREALIATGVVLFVFILLINLCFSLVKGAKRMADFAATAGKTDDMTHANAKIVPPARHENRMAARAYALVMRWLVRLAALITVAILVFLIGYILVNGIPNLKPSLFEWTYNSDNVSLMPALINTILMTAFSLAIATPLGIFAAVWLVEYAKRGSKLVKVVRITTETLQGIPSIVYGLFGMLFFVMQLKWGYSLIAGAFTLAIMVLPVIMRTTEEALLAVPDSYREGSFGLGAGKLRTVFTIVLPSAMPGILSGVILATGRIVGETAALIYTASTVAAVPASVFSSTRTLATHMYLLSNEGLHINETYGTAVVLLILVLLINSLSSFIAGRLAKK